MLTCNMAEWWLGRMNCMYLWTERFSALSSLYYVMAGWRDHVVADSLHLYPDHAENTNYYYIYCKITSKLQSCSTWFITDWGYPLGDLFLELYSLLDETMNWGPMYQDIASMSLYSSTTHSPGVGPYNLYSTMSSSSYQTFALEAMGQGTDSAERYSLISE